MNQLTPPTMVETSHAATNILNTTAAIIAQILTFDHEAGISPSSSLSSSTSSSSLALLISSSSTSSPIYLSSSTGSNSDCIGNCSEPIFHRDYFSPTQRNILWTTTIVGTSLSIFGTSLITISYLVYPSLRTFPYKLIAILSLSDFLSSISYLIPTGTDLPTHTPSGDIIHPSPSTACIVQASMSQFFSLATFMWTTVFSFNIFEVLVRQKSNVETFERYYHVICWGVPLIFLAINLGMASFGPTLIWCWIDSAHNALRIATFYAPLIACFVINLIFYLFIGRSLRGMGEEKQVAINSRLRQYLVVFFFVRIWSLLNRFQNALQPNQPIFALYVLHSCASTLQGFANSIIYGANVRVRAHYRALFTKWKDAIRSNCCKAQTRLSRSGWVHHQDRMITPAPPSSSSSTPAASSPNDHLQPYQLADPSLPYNPSSLDSSFDSTALSFPVVDVYFGRTANHFTPPPPQMSPFGQQSYQSLKDEAI